MGEGHTLRRGEKALDAQIAWQVLEKGEWGVLSLVDTKGLPYGVPINYALEKGNTPRLVFHCALEGKKIHCLQHVPHASFTVVGCSKVIEKDFTSKFISVIASGSVNFINDVEEKQRYLLYLTDKYSPEFAEEAKNYAARSVKKGKVVVFVMDISELQAKGNWDE